MEEAALALCMAAALHRRQKTAWKKAKIPCSPRANREIKRTQTRLLTGWQQVDIFLEGPRAPGCLGSVRSGNLRLSAVFMDSLSATAEIDSLARAEKNDVPAAPGSAITDRSFSEGPRGFEP